MNVQQSMRNRDCAVISFFFLSISTSRNKMAFQHKIWCFWMQKFPQTHFFQVGFQNFWQKSGFFALLMIAKEQGTFFISNKCRTYFSLLKKNKAHFLLLKKGRVYCSTSYAMLVLGKFRAGKYVFAKNF